MMNENGILLGSGTNEFVYLAGGLPAIFVINFPLSGSVEYSKRREDKLVTIP